MKSFILFVVATLLQSTLALASTPPEAVPGIDAAREGDLAKQAAAYFEKNGASPACESYTATLYKAYKIDSGSAHDEKGTPFTTTYDATYLVIKHCGQGTTYVGAYLDATDAAIVTATRNGPENDQGVIIPVKPDLFKIVGKVDLKTLRPANP